MSSRVESLSRPSALRVWWLAMRPATLWAAVAPVMVGTACAFAARQFRPGPALGALLVAILIQIGTNLANDLFDFRKGADTTERLGPTRAVQAGWLSEHEVWVGTWLAFGAAMVAGLYLAWVAGPWLVVVGLVSILSGVLYTAGPAPIGYIGLGDVFVFVFFGWVAVVGTCYVQTLTIEPLAVWAAAPMGALATAILVVNNLRDVSTDVKAGKKTLAVRFGRTFARFEYLILVLGTFLVPLWLYWKQGFSWPVLLPMILAPFTPALLTRAFTRHGVELNPLLGDTAKLLLAFAVLFSIGIVWATVPAAPVDSGSAAVARQFALRQ